MSPALLIGQGAAGWWFAPPAQADAARAAYSAADEEGTIQAEAADRALRSIGRASSSSQPLSEVLLALGCELRED